MLSITSSHLQQIRGCAEKIYPQECCGLLLGTIKNHQKLVLEVRETDNVWRNQETEYSFDKEKDLSKCNRFSIAPEVLLQVQKEVRDRQINLIGIYHSHPDHPATPSEFDRVIAWPQYSYIIVSVKQGKATDIKSWQLDENQQFQPEILANIM